MNVYSVFEVRCHCKGQLERWKMLIVNSELTFEWKLGIGAPAEPFLAEITDCMKSRMSCNTAVLGSSSHLFESYWAYQSDLTSNNCQY